MKPLAHYFCKGVRHSSSTRCRVHHCPGHICSKIKRLPTSVVLSDLKKSGENPMVPGGVGGIRQGLLNDSPVAIKTLHTRNSNDVVKAKKVSKRWLFEICLRKDYRCIGNGCQCGGNYSIRTYYPSVASTPHAYTFPSFMTGVRGVTLSSTSARIPASLARCWCENSCYCDESGHSLTSLSLYQMDSCWKLHGGWNTFMV